MCSSCASVAVLLIVLVLIIAFNLKLIFPSLDLFFLFIFLLLPNNVIFSTSCHLFSFPYKQLAVPASDLSPYHLAKLKSCVQERQNLC